jgi:(2Fe-2S) ferredoxin
MGQYDRHVFVCTSGETCPTQGDVEAFVKALREGVRGANLQGEVRVNKAGCFSQCGHGPIVVVYPENVWYAGVQAGDLKEILEEDGYEVVGETGRGDQAIELVREQDRRGAQEGRRRPRRRRSGSACARPGTCRPTA